MEEIFKNFFIFIFKVLVTFFENKNLLHAATFAAFWEIDS